MSKKLRYTLEAGAMYVTFGLFRMLPVTVASALGGRIARFIGPKLAVSRKALRNIEQAFPDQPPETYMHILNGMWDNLGRVYAEYPHLETIARHRTHIQGIENIDKIKKDATPLIFFSAHMANWEIAAPAFYCQTGLKGGLIYRPPNNPTADYLLRKARSLNGVLNMIPKSERGVRQMVQMLREKKYLGILIDQKFNKGIAAPFFGRPAMTSPAFVELAQKYNAALFPVQINRLNNVQFEIIVHPPLETAERPVAEVVTDAHVMLEQWITERPAQWLWLHRRWDSRELQESTQKEEDRGHETV
ncbi:MAG: lipid A biosynthesis acyltransferase [Rhodospirillales bacterium]|nr:lipid A biosynthesis acyltransferase [Rhodospirillales bacterium]MCB9964824.1 lipid A biosynthesis acyltransferase [Rhodospirillales bacterium]